MYLNRLHRALALCLLLLPVVAGCRKADTAEELTGSPITFIPRGAELDGSEDQTKAVTPTTSLDGTGFYVSAVNGNPGADVQKWTNVHFSKSGDSFVSSKYWPVSNQNYRFFASSAPLTYTSSGATISANNTSDIVCAYKSNPVYGARNTLQFEHIFARISTVTVAATAPYNVSNISIWIVNPKTGGTYNLYSGAGQTSGTGWSSLTPSGSSETQLYSNAGTIAAGGSNTGSDNDLYLVPGTYFLRASWTAGIDNYTESFVDKVSSTPVSVVGGKVNAIEAVLDGNATEIRFAVSLSPWGSNTIGDVVFPVL